MHTKHGAFLVKIKRHNYNLQKTNIYWLTCKTLCLCAYSADLMLFCAIRAEQAFFVWRIRRVSVPFAPTLPAVVLMTNCKKM